MNSISTFKDMYSIITIKIQRWISRGFILFGSFLLNMGSRISEQRKHSDRFSKWFADKGDKTYRLYYEINDQCIVFDIGGYEGQWASDIYSMYRCKIHIFEPVISFAENIKKRFKNNSDIIIHQFGLSDDNKNVEISIKDDSSSIIKHERNKNNTCIVKLVSVEEFFRENNIKKIDLVKINIEGAEYELLEHLLDKGYIKNIINIQVQFHSFFPNAEKRMLNIQKRLMETHELTYQYRFVWENWRIKQNIK